MGDVMVCYGMVWYAMLCYALKYSDISSPLVALILNPAIKKSYNCFTLNSEYLGLQ